MAASLLLSSTIDELEKIAEKASRKERLKRVAGGAGAAALLLRNRAHYVAKAATSNAVAAKTGAGTAAVAGKGALASKAAAAGKGALLAAHIAGPAILAGIAGYQAIKHRKKIKKAMKSGANKALDFVAGA